MADTPASPFAVQPEVRGPWRRYLDALAPLRPDLHRYCCRLTGNVWDGEDLAQDALLRVFGLLSRRSSAAASSSNTPTR
jgi:DNA-directed RNA polymerase specialized sigma24 family protein